MMKARFVKIFYIIIWGWAASCTSSTVMDEPDTETDLPVTFGTTVSRGIVESNRKGMQPFTVWGGYGGKNNLFQAETIQPDGSYSPLRYWRMGHDHHFYALHPAVNELKTKKMQASCTDAGQITVTGYDGSKYRGDQVVDLLTAFPAHITPDPLATPAPVSLTFQHELAWIEIIIAAEQAIKINNVSLTNIVYGGDYTISPTDKVGTWTRLLKSDPITGQPFLDPPFYVTPQEVNKPFTLLGGHLFLPPQVLTDDCVFYMDWVYTDMPSEVRKVTVKMPQTGVTLWEKGKHYVYSAIIPPTPVNMTLSVSVEPWKPKRLDVIL